MRRKSDPEASMPLLKHLKELRKVLMVVAYAVAAGALGGWLLSDPVFAYLARPITHLGQGFVTLTPMEAVLVKLKMSLVIGCVIASPIIFWQLWSFILPALKQNETKLIYIAAPCSLFLFLCGISFCFFYVLPVGVKFLLYVGKDAVETTTLLSKASFLSFVLTFLLTFGLVFQIPIVLLMLIRGGIVTPQTLAKKRRWAFFIIVLLAAIVSPTPDLMTQGLMVVPMYLLYEVSIWLGYLTARRRKKRLAEQE
ncbi:MAG: twin-arginine translocase subunit TatC [Peptococcaceae bacterium]|nr:twin-arginine translocase subunit TatC [Peptococcaceae bacterium]